MPHDDPCMQVHQFMRKATSPEVCLYPAAVETWVQRHKYDVSPEERWRAGIASQVRHDSLMALR